jgi:antitoxin component HigA of HigAB toxin-antitoxin module
MKLTISKSVISSITKQKKPAANKKEHSAELAELLSSLMQAAGLSYGDVGQILGMHRIAVSYMCNRRSAIPIKHIDTLCDYLGLSLVLSVEPKEVQNDNPP